MMIPSTYAITLLLTILTMLCWGSWANTMKLSGKWRFELFYFDYTFGLVLATLIAVFTFGSIESAAGAASGMPAFSFIDNMTVAPRTNIAYALAGGVIFNLANLLLVAAIALAGLSVAFPVGIGLALLVGVVLNYIVKPAGSPVLLFGGSLVIVAAIIVTALAHAKHAAAKAKAAPPQPAAQTLRQGHQSRRHSRGSGALRGILLSLAGGLLMGVFYPIVELSKRGDLGLGPYAAAFCFAMGVLVSTPVFNLFFMNLPVEGEPVGPKDYLAGTGKQHLLGVLGGVIWAVGTISNFVASSAPASVNVGPAVSYGIGQGATLISTLWGLLAWKEFAGATASVKVYLVLLLALFSVGIVMLSLAPLY